MVNCGIGMCSNTSTSCGLGIAQMAIDTISAIGRATAFVLSFGTSSVATSQMASAKQAIKNNSKLVQKGVQSGAAAMKAIANNPAAKKTFMERARKYTYELLKGIVVDSAKSKIVEGVCTGIHESLMNKAAQKEEGFKMDWEKLDVLGVTEINRQCSDLKKDGASLNCSKSILQTLDWVDPIGIAGLAATFMHPTCDI